MGHALTHAWEDLTQRSQVEEECQSGAGGFGEPSRCHQAGIPAQSSPHKMARRSVLGERVQPVHHALVLRYVMRSRLEGLAERLARWAGAWRERAAEINGAECHRLRVRRRR